MSQRHAKTHWTAVVLHVQRVAREAERFGEVIHDFGDVIERVRELFRVGPVAVTEAWVIGRDQVVPTRKPGEERLEHPRRRGKTMQQEQHRPVFRAGLSIKNRKPI